MVTDSVHFGFGEDAAAQGPNDETERWRWVNGLERKPEMVRKNPDAPITAEQNEMMDPFYKLYVEGVK